MPKYKLTFFNAKARGEMVRMMLVAAGVPYEDHRIKFEEWAALKPTTPLGSLPVLEIDGRPFPESVALTRHIAREYGYDGKDNMEKLKADILVEQVVTLREDCITILFEKDEARKAELTKKFKEETAPKLYGFLEKVLSNATNGFLVGSQLTYADIVLASVTDFISMKQPDVPPTYAKIIAHQQKIEALPKLAYYLKTRPVTEN